MLDHANSAEAGFEGRQLALLATATNQRSTTTVISRTSLM
jgi:hypothetical protein